MKIRWSDVWWLIVFVVIAQAAGVIGSIFTTPAIPTWYIGLVKPSFNPPSWLFAPVWTALYTLMGISSLLIYKKIKKIDINLIIYFLHLAVNALWSIIFFGQQNIFGALMIIAVLWLMILFLIIRFWSITKTASILLWPYLAWVSFASLLNFYLWRLN